MQQLSERKQSIANSSILIPEDFDEEAHPLDDDSSDSSDDSSKKEEQNEKFVVNEEVI